MIKGFQHTITDSEINPEPRKGVIRHNQEHHDYLRGQIEEHNQQLESATKTIQERHEKDLQSLSKRSGMDEQGKSFERRKLELKKEEAEIDAQTTAHGKISRLKQRLQAPLDTYQAPARDRIYEVEFHDERIRQDAWVDVHVLTPQGETRLDTFHGTFYYREGAMRLVFEYFLPVRQLDGPDADFETTNVVSVQLPSPVGMELAIYVGEVNGAK